MNLSNEIGKARKRRAVYLLPVTGFLLMATLVAAEVFWETKGRELVLYQDILVAKEDIKRGTLISAETVPSLFKVEKYEKGKIIDQPVFSPQEVVGLAAKQVIPKNAQLSALYFEDSRVLTDGQHLNWKIPNEWIISAPNTIRRKDRITVYEITALALANQKNTAADKIQIDPNQPATQQQAGGEKKLDVQKSGDVPVSQYERKRLLDGTVTYVKDSVNREVVSTSVVDRIDASSSVKDIEIILTLDELAALEAAVLRGSKLMIGYTEEREAAKP